MKRTTSHQEINPSQFVRATLMRTCRALLLGGLFMASGCLSAPMQQNRQERETHATASLPGLQTPARQPSRYDDPGASVRDLLADELTPETAVRVALSNNRRIQADYDRLDLAAADRLAARLLKNPQVEGSIAVSTEDSSEEIIELGAEIDLLHMILLPKRRRIGAADYEVVALDVARAVQTLAFDTRVACYRLLASQQRLDMHESILQVADAARDMAHRLREAGNIKELDKLSRDALYEQAALGVSAAELAVVEARENLNVLMGLSGGETSWRMAGELPQPGSSGLSADEVVNDALKNSVQLAMLRWDIEAAAQALGIAKAESVIPALHVGVDAEREADGVWFVGPRIAVELPLFDFGQARRPAAAAALRRLRHEYAAVAIEIAAAARRSEKRADVASERVRRYRDTLLPLRRDITRRTQLQYNAMQLGVFQLLQAKHMEMAADSAYIDELLNYWIAAIETEQVRKGLLVDRSGTVSSSSGAPMEGGREEGH